MYPFDKIRIENGLNFKICKIIIPRFRRKVNSKLFEIFSIFRSTTERVCAVMMSMDITYGNFWQQKLKKKPIREQLKNNTKCNLNNKPNAIMSVHKYVELCCQLGSVIVNMFTLMILRVGCGDLLLQLMLPIGAFI